MESTFNKDSKLTDLIKVYKNVIPESIRKDIIDRSSNYDWRDYGWLSYKKVKDEVAVSSALIDEYPIVELLPILKSSVSSYNKEVASPFNFEIKEITSPEIHKFLAGSKMLLHHDHGYRGVPLLTVLSLLNDDFSGGEFIFWNDEVVKLEAGDILLFPSIFPYTHQVTPVTAGIRYSVVAWVF